MPMKLPVSLLFFCRYMGFHQSRRILLYPAMQDLSTTNGGIGAVSIPEYHTALTAMESVMPRLDMIMIIE